jgi:hypothetical protein
MKATTVPPLLVYDKASDDEISKVKINDEGISGGRISGPEADGRQC